jgi:hypothetical protein
MTELSEDFAIAQTLALLSRYAFDLKGYMVNDLIAQWLDRYHASWLRLATIEALYLGRYKAVSVEQILSVWLRLGSPNYHFNHDFERLICRNLPRYLTELSEFSQQNREENEQLEKVKTDSGKSIELFSPSSLTNANASLEAEQSNLSETIPVAEELGEIFTEVNSIPQETADVREIKEDWEEATKKPPTKNCNLPITDGESLSSAARRIAKQTPIYQFVPSQDGSDFFSRLRTFVRQSLEEE